MASSVKHDPCPVNREVGWACWVLRVAVALEFSSHGWLAFTGKATWVPFVTFWGIPPELALSLMRVVGVVDCALAVHVLVRPLLPLVGWMAFWGLFTALLRPLTGEPMVEFLERGANWGAPLALFVLLWASRNRSTSAG